MSAPKQIIKPLVDLPSDREVHDKIDELITRLNWLLDVMPCLFDNDNFCRLHNSPRIFIEASEILDTAIRATDYCGIAQKQMKERLAN